MIDKDKIIENLQAEAEKLKAELEQAKKREKGLEDSRGAMLNMLEDLSESAGKVEQAKKEWEATFDGISAPLFAHNKEFKIIRANKAYQKAAGLPFNQFIGKPYYDIFPKMEGPFKICLKALELQEEKEEEFSYPAANRIFNVRVYPIKDVEGKYLYSIHIMEDITEAKKAEEALKASQEYANNVINSSLNMIVAVDNDRRITMFNKAAAEVFGYEADEVIGKSVDVLYANPEDGLNAHRMTMEHGRYVKEILNRRKNGEEFTSLLSSSILKDLRANTIGVMGISQDVTERKKAEERLKQEMEITTHLLMIARATRQTTDMDKLAHQVAQCTAKITGCDACLIYLWSKEEKEFRPGHAYGLDNVFMPFFRTEMLDSSAGFIREAFEKNEPVIVEDFQFQKRAVSNPYSKIFQWIPDIRAFVAIPLAGHKERLGFIFIAYKNPRKMIERDMALMGAVAGHVSIALEEARLYRESIEKTMELSRKIETIQAMHEIDRSILSTLQPHEIMETACRMVSRIITAADRVTIALVDKEKGGFRYVAGAGDDKAIKDIGFASFNQTSAADILNTGMAEYAANLKEIAEPLPVEKKLIEAGFISHVRIPVTVRGEIAGILTVGSKRPAAFTAEDLSILEKIASQIGVALENARLLTDLQDLFIGTVKTLSETIDAKSRWTRGHSDRVTKYGLAIAKEMGLDERTLKDLEIAGLLHDIGKIGTYEAILDKPGKLTEEEMKLMQQHPGKGADMLSSIKQLKGIIPAIKYHHEFYDGTGYPEGLKGEAIPLSARILGVADTVDAMGADRPYRKGKPMDAIIAELKRCSGTQFDPNVVEAFLKVLTKGIDVG